MTDIKNKVLVEEVEKPREEKQYNPNQKLPEDEVSIEEVSQLIKEGTRYQEELKDKLKDIKVPVNSKHPHVLNSIRNIFGDDYIDHINGKAYITFDMVVECMKLVRSVGKATASEL